MKLYNVPRNSWITLKEDPKTPIYTNPVENGERIFFYNLDGAFSYCENENGDIVHIGASTEVEIDENADS